MLLNRLEQWVTFHMALTHPDVENGPIIYLHSKLKLVRQVMSLQKHCVRSGIEAHDIL